MHKPEHTNSQIFDTICQLKNTIVESSGLNKKLNLLLQSPMLPATVETYLITAPEHIRKQRRPEQVWLGRDCDKLPHRRIDTSVLTMDEILDILA